MKRAAAGALLVLNIALALAVARADVPRLRRALDISLVESGEALRLAMHPRNSDPSSRMPIDSLSEAAAFSRLSPFAFAAWAVFLYATTALLVHALASELGGGWAGPAAAAAWQALFLGLPFGPGFFKQFWLTNLGLLAAVALVRHARRPSLLTAAGVGAAFGLAGLTRSTYVLFPPLLAAAEGARPGAARSRLARAGFLLVFFALPLAPWIAMNASVKKRFQAVEYGAGDLNIVAGALGALHGVEGDPVAWMDAPESARGKSPIGWAVRTVLAHPGPYARGAARRAAYTLGLEPWLFALALLGLILARRDAGARALALQCAYFLAIVCAMPVEADYFQPLWPLLLALAAAPLARLEPPPGARAGARAAGAGVALAAVLGGLIAARCGFLALSYAARTARRAPDSDAALDEALARRPFEAWVSLADARRRLRRGDAAGAVRALEASAPALGDLPRARMLLAWARAKTGDPGPLLALSVPDVLSDIPYNDKLWVKLPIYQALALDSLGLRSDARDSMRAALTGRSREEGFIHPEEEPLSGRVEPRLVRRAEKGFAETLEALLDDAPAADVARALELAADVDPTFEVWLALGRARAAAGRRREAVSALERAEALAREPEQYERLQFRWVELGEGARARRLLETLTRRFPGRALYWSDLGVALDRGGDPRGAERAFQRALAAEPGMPAASLSLATLLDARGAHDEARRLCASANTAGLEDGGLREHLQACREGRRD